MTLIVAHRRTKEATLKQRFADPLILDVTSKATEPWVQFSPFYPHGNIPIPFADREVGVSVEGIWQGLKVFERADIDPKKWTISTMKGIKRSARTLGRVLGHRAGPTSDRLLNYLDARRQIYLPCYHWVLDNKLTPLIQELKDLADQQTVILLDYESNGDIEDLSKPLSHAALLKAYCENSA